MKKTLLSIIVLSLSTSVFAAPRRQVICADLRSTDGAYTLETHSSCATYFERARDVFSTSAPGVCFPASTRHRVNAKTKSIAVEMVNLANSQKEMCFIGTFIVKKKVTTFTVQKIVEPTALVIVE